MKAIHPTKLSLLPPVRMDARKYQLKNRMYTNDLGSYVSMTRLHSLSSLRSMSASGPKYLVIFGVLVYAYTDHMTELTEENWPCYISCVDLSWYNC